MSYRAFTFGVEIKNYSAGLTCAPKPTNKKPTCAKVSVGEEADLSAEVRRAADAG